jgi:hypothetical protein
METGQGLLRALAGYSKKEAHCAMINNVIIDGQPGMVTKVMPKDYKGFAFKLGENEYSRILKKEIGLWAGNCYLYKIVLQNGKVLYKAYDYDIYYIPTTLPVN